jgi:hypothetical protein
MMESQQRFTTENTESTEKNQERQNKKTRQTRNGNFPTSFLFLCCFFSVLSVFSVVNPLSLQPLQLVASSGLFFRFDVKPARPGPGVAVCLTSAMYASSR